jgi:hypothetical protein
MAKQIAEAKAKPKKPEPEKPVAAPSKFVPPAGGFPLKLDDEVSAMEIKKTGVLVKSAGGGLAFVPGVKVQGNRLVPA